MTRKLTNLLAYLDERLGAHRGRGPEYQFDCPACVDRKGSESKQRKLGINLERGVGGCFRCGFAFRKLSSLFRYLNGGAIRAEELALLRDEAELPAQDIAGACRRAIRRTTDRVRLRPVTLPPEHVKLTDVPLRAALSVRPAFQYLARRGVGEDLIERFQIGYCPLGYFGRRLVFPVQQGGRKVYFTTRYCGDDNPAKALNPENQDGYHHRDTVLFNYDACVGHPTVALVEGAFDVMGFASTSVPAMGLLAKYVTPEQLRLIRSLVGWGLKEIVVAGDPGAGSEADAIESLLRGLVPKVSRIAFRSGDPWDHRDRLDRYLVRRTDQISTAERIRQRLAR